MPNQVVLSLAGCAMVVKGSWRMIRPQAALRVYSGVLARGEMPFRLGGIISIGFGVFLAWLAFRPQ
jgi:uncharacterized protein YjeT (DUF2065 family)